LAWALWLKIFPQTRNRAESICNKAYILNNEAQFSGFAYVNTSNKSGMWIFVVIFITSGVRPRRATEIFLPTMSFFNEKKRAY